MATPTPSPARGETTSSMCRTAPATTHTVDCGEDVGDADNDTVYFDHGDVIANCEQQNPI